MTGRRALVALALLGIAAPVMSQAGCVSVVGVDLATHTSVVHDMCLCDQLRYLGKPAECEATLNARFDGIGPADNTAWLAKYTSECTECGNVLACLGERPTCVLLGCAIDAECCQVPGTATNICLAGGSCGTLK